MSSGEATEVKAEDKLTPSPKMSVRLSNGLLQVANTVRNTRSYLVRNRGKHARTLVIEHPIRENWRLDGAMKTYTELLKRDPDNVDAAYNFELMARLRDAASKAKPAPPSKREDPARALQKLTGVAMAGDLPEGRTVHGEPGAPPPNTDMTQFKMHIPVRPDERQGGSDAGQGQKKIRKG